MPPVVSELFSGLGLAGGGGGGGVMLSKEQNRKQCSYSPPLIPPIRNQCHVTEGKALYELPFVFCTSALQSFHEPLRQLPSGLICRLSSKVKCVMIRHV